MRQMLAILLVACMAVGLWGCAKPVVEVEITPENTPDLTAKTTSIPVVSPEPSSTPEIISISEGVVKTSSGDITISVFTENGEVHGGAICVFTGIDLVTEYEYLLAATYYFAELNIDYTVGGFSGEDVIVLSGEDGKMVSASKQMAKYDALEIDYDRAMEHFEEIVTVLSAEQ